MHVMIHEIEIGDNGEKLYLVTTLEEDSYSLADRYRHRYDVETDIKEVKVALDTENIRAKSKEMVLKELYTSLTAYNLLIQFRRQAAAYAGVPARRLSFQEIWNTYNSFLKIDLAVRDPEACLDRYEQALEIASRAKIPERPGRRYQRAAHPRRPKTTKEQKAARKRKPPVNTEDDENAPNSTKSVPLGVSPRFIRDLLREPDANAWRLIIAGQSLACLFHSQRIGNQHVFVVVHEGGAASGEVGYISDASLAFGCCQDRFHLFPALSIQADDHVVRRRMIGLGRLTFTDRPTAQTVHLACQRKMDLVIVAIKFLGIGRMSVQYRQSIHFKELSAK
jgi:hypothetical protein